MVLEGVDYAQVTSYVGNTLYWFGIIFWFLLGIGVVVVFWFIITFNIPTHVYEVVGKQQMLRFLRKTRSKVVSKDDVLKLKVFGIKDEFEPPQSEDYMLSKRGKLLNLKKDGTDFTPFVMTSNPGHITIQDHDKRFWLSQTVGQTVKKYTEITFFQKYGAYMALIFGMLVLGWMFYIMITTVGADVDRNLAIAEKVAEYTKKSIAGP